MEALRKFSLSVCKAPQRARYIPSYYCSAVAPMCITPLNAACRFASTAPQQKGPNYYKRLEVSTDATPQEIKAAYRRLALQCHPDVVEDNKKSMAEAQFRAVSEAYEVLSDAQQRRAHDDRLGIKTARKQDKKAASAPAEKEETRREKPSYSSMYGTSNYRNRGTDAAEDEREERRQQQQAAKARVASARRKRNYVRRDADRAFADAFDGKTLDQVIFEARRRKRQEAALKATHAAVSDHKDGVSSTREKPAGREETMRRVMEHASEAFADQAAKQYGHGILKHVRVYQRNPFRQAVAPPSGHMPFRPFLNWEVPEGVTTPILKEKEPASNVADAAKNGEPTYVPLTERESEWVRQITVPEFTLEDGTVMSRNYGLSRLRQNVRGMANNMGQLYSYHRPY